MPAWLAAARTRCDHSLHHNLGSRRDKLSSIRTVLVLYDVLMFRYVTVIRCSDGRQLGIVHLVIRPGKLTDNAEVERCHRTVNDYAIVGNEDADAKQLQQILDQAVYELDYELPSRAEGCGGLPPVVAHPELLQPHRPFQPEHELAFFDLKRVDAYLATFTWQRKVGKTGQITIGGRHQRYSVGRPYAHRQVLVRFDPADRHFVFYDVDDPEMEIGRRPARDLEVTDLTGLTMWPEGLGFQQLPLPLFFSEGVIVNEQMWV